MTTGSFGRDSLTLLYPSLAKRSAVPPRTEPALFPLVALQDPVTPPLAPPEECRHPTMLPNIFVDNAWPNAWELEYPVHLSYRHGNHLVLGFPVLCWVFLRVSQACISSTSS